VVKVITDRLETKYEYDACYRRTKKVENQVATTSYHYDKNGNLIRNISPREYALEQDKASGVQYEYDSMQRLTRVIRPDGSVLVSYQYNAYNELVLQQDGKEEGVSFVYDFAGRRTQINTLQNTAQRFEYDARGNLIAAIDGNKNKTSYLLNPWGTIHTIQKPDGNSLQYEYDFAGNVISQIDENKNRTLFGYNEGNQLAWREDDVGNREFFSYNESGRLSCHQKYDGTKVSYRYNMFGSLTYRGCETTKEQDLYGYLPNAQLSYAIGGGMRYDYDYDDFGRLLTKRASGKTLLSYVYDLNGNKIRQTDVSGKELRYEYDRCNRLSAIFDQDRPPVRYHYQADDKVARVEIGDFMTTRMEYDADKNLIAQVTTWKEPQNINAQNNTLNANHNPYVPITALNMEQNLNLHTYPLTADQNFKVLLDLRMKYDSNGNIIQRKEKDTITSYEYDSLNQLIRIQTPEGLEQYGYDAVGNRTSYDTKDKSYRYEYNSLNQLLSMECRCRKDSQLLEQGKMNYDKNGNLVEDDHICYSYDAFDRMIKAEINTTYVDNEGMLEGNVKGAINEGLRDTQNETLNKPLNETLSENLNKTLDETRNDTINGSTYNTFDRRVNQILARTIDERSDGRRDEIHKLRSEARRNKILDMPDNIQINRYYAEGLRHEMQENACLVQLIYSDKRIVTETKQGEVSRYIWGHQLIASDSESARTYYHYASDDLGSIRVILDENQQVINQYQYDAFGNIIYQKEQITNRFQYAGEVYDHIIGQYYLRARFYNPVIGRFTQADIIMETVPIFTLTVRIIPFVILTQAATRN